MKKLLFCLSLIVLFENHAEAAKIIVKPGVHPYKTNVAFELEVLDSEGRVRFSDYQSIDFNQPEQSIKMKNFFEKVKNLMSKDRSVKLENRVQLSTSGTLEWVHCSTIDMEQYKKNAAEKLNNSLIMEISVNKDTQKLACKVWFSDL